MKKFSCVCNQYEGLYKYTFGDAIRLCQLHTRQGVITYQSFGLNKNSTAIAMLFLVTRTRIIKASLDDLLRKYPIICPFRLRLWRTAERWTIEFDSLKSINKNTKKKAPVFLQVLFW